MNRNILRVIWTYKLAVLTNIIILEDQLLEVKLNLQQDLQARTILFKNRYSLSLEIVW